MKSVLLANIGNRNITYKGKMYFEDIGAKRDATFRVWTKNILDNYEEVKGDLDINIINPIIKDQRPGRIILFFSDQSALNTRIDQDTLYEAEIMKNILINAYDYNVDDIAIKKLDCKVIDNGALMRSYRRELLKVKRNLEHGDLITICDAGGTAQQKMALKVMAEYLLDKDQYKVVYTEKNQLVSDVNVNEYRSVINAEEAIRLIHNGQYGGAAKLLDYNHLELAPRFSKKEWKKRVFAHCYWRFYGNYEMAFSSIQGVPVSHPIIKNYQNRKLDIKNQRFGDNFDIVDIQRILDRFSKAEFFYSINNYSSSILAFSQFYEDFFATVLEKSYPHKKYGSPQYSNDERRQRFTNQILRDIPDILNRIGRINIIDLSLQCIIAKEYPNTTIQTLASIISPHIDYSDDAIKGKAISSWRNRIAHDGYFVSETDIKNKIDYYPDLLKNIRHSVLPDQPFVFQELNTILENIIRQ